MIGLTATDEFKLLSTTNEDWQGKWYKPGSH